MSPMLLRNRDALLYILCILIWGSTWFGVHLQMGEVRPEVSVALRFLASSVLLFIFCLFTKRSLKFSPRNHILFFFQGFLVFFIGYIFSYKAIEHVTSGVVAVFFCLLPFFNIFYSKIFFKKPIEWILILASFLGVLGVSLVFGNEWNSIEDFRGLLWGFLFSILGANFSALGNMVAIKMAKEKIPIASWNAYGMGYGALLNLIYCSLNQYPVILDPRLSYWLAFIFLSLFGSVIAFGAYYLLQNSIGADRAAYMTVLFPIIALIYSTAFENYHWSPLAFVGVLTVLAGNILIIPRSNSSAESQKFLSRLLSYRRKELKTPVE